LQANIIWEHVTIIDPIIFIEDPKDNFATGELVMRG